MALLDRATQALSSTDLQRKCKTVLDELQGGDKDKYVVMRENKPCAVLLSVPHFEALLQEIHELRQHQ